MPDSPVLGVPRVLWVLIMSGERFLDNFHADRLIGWTGWICGMSSTRATLTFPTSNNGRSNVAPEKSMRAVKEWESWIMCNKDERTMKRISVDDTEPDRVTMRKKYASE